MKYANHLLTLLFVGGCVAVLWTVAYPRFSSHQVLMDCAQRLQNAATRIDEYRAAHGSYPPTLQDLGFAPRLLTCARDGREFEYYSPAYSTRFDAEKHAIVRCLSHHYWKGRVDIEDGVHEDGTRFVYEVPVLPVGTTDFRVLGAKLSGWVGVVSSACPWAERIPLALDQSVSSKNVLERRRSNQ